MKVLLSIKPEYVEKILSGEKCFEFRKVLFRQDVEKVIIYSTMPVGKIVGEFQIDKVLSDSPSNLWEETKDSAGISFDFFSKYFSDRKVAHAIKIKNVEKYEVEVDPLTIFEKFTAPQSFMYMPV